MPQKAITIATDFSGLDCPVTALQKMGISYKHVFSCDNDIHCKKQILANHSPVCFFDDIKAFSTEREDRYLRLGYTLSSVQRSFGKTDIGNKELEDTREHGSDQACVDHYTSFASESVYLRKCSSVREGSGLHETDESDKKVQIRYVQHNTEQ